MNNEEVSMEIEELKKVNTVERERIVNLSNNAIDLLDANIKTVDYTIKHFSLSLSSREKILEEFLNLNEANIDLWTNAETIHTTEVKNAMVRTATLIHKLEVWIGHARHSNEVSRLEITSTNSATNSPKYSFSLVYLFAAIGFISLVYALFR